jgi:hypothetical protein
MLPVTQDPAMRAPFAPLLALVALPPLLAGCAEGLSNAPYINREWNQEDFQHDVISNGPESCPKAGEQDPLAPKGQRRSNCPETPSKPQGNAPASP